MNMVKKFTAVLAIASGAALAVPAVAAITIDGSRDAAYGAAKGHVASVPKAAEGTYLAPSTTTTSVGYSVYLTSDANWVYGYLQADGPVSPATNFANLYFDFDSRNGATSDAGFEITNQNLIFGGTTFYLPNSIEFAYGPDAIEFALSNAFFLNSSSNAVPGGPITLRLSQTFGYSVVNAPASRTGLGATVLAPSAVPEPATWAMMLVGFAAIGSALRSRPRKTTTVRFA